jgi:hypothetical protein
MDREVKTDGERGEMKGAEKDKLFTRIITKGPNPGN